MENLCKEKVPNSRTEETRNPQKVIFWHVIRRIVGHSVIQTASEVEGSINASSKFK